MNAQNFIIRNGQVVHGGEVEQADVLVEDGHIAAIGPELSGTGVEVDASGKFVFPGVVDCHVHFNDPGRAHWEGWHTGSSAAAIGGTTTVIDMPFNAIPPTVDAESFHLKVDSAAGRSFVDFGLYGGMHGGNLNSLEELSALGVSGFKAYMCDTGLEEFPGIGADDLFRGMEIAASLGRPVLVHAETPPVDGGAGKANRSEVSEFLANRPIQTETAAVKSAIEMAEATGAKLHIVHLTTGTSATLVAEAQARGVDVTAETCPHYLTFTTDDVERLGAVAKCAPPIRGEDNREELWQAISDNTISIVASDHSPSSAEEKLDKTFQDAWGGIAGCQSLLASLVTEGWNERSMSFPRIAQLLGEGPADRFGLVGKGRLAVGREADLLVVEASTPALLGVGDLLYQHSMSPYLGRKFLGSVVHGWRSGQSVVVDGKLNPEATTGRYIPTEPSL